MTYTTVVISYPTIIMTYPTVATTLRTFSLVQYCMSRFCLNISNWYHDSPNSYYVKFTCCILKYIPCNSHTYLTVLFNGIILSNQSVTYSLHDFNVTYDGAIISCSSVTMTYQLCHDSCTPVIVTYPTDDLTYPAFCSGQPGLETE